MAFHWFWVSVRLIQIDHGFLSSFRIVVIAWLLLKYFVKPVRRAFLCSDMSLYHPPPEKKVFPTWLLFICAIVIPIILVWKIWAYPVKCSSWFSFRFFYQKVFDGIIFFERKLHELFTKFKSRRKFTADPNGLEISTLQLVRGIRA